MYAIWDIIWFVVITVVTLVVISALLGAVLLVFGVVGLYQTHNPIFIVPIVLGMVFAAAVD